MWQMLKGLEGRELTTLSQRRPFHVLQVSDDQIYFQTSTGRHRQVSRRRAEAAWNELLRTGSLTLRDIVDVATDLNSTYVAAMLATLPGVVVERSPIRLRYVCSQH